MKRAIGFLFTFCISAILWSQSYEIKFEKVSDSRGKAPGATFSIVQDDRGVIWFGTLAGLYKYDGYSFKIYKHEKNNPNSLSANAIRAMCLDKNGNIWIGTQGGGVNMFNQQTEEFTRYIHSESDENTIGGSDVWAIDIDHDGRIWAGHWGQGISVIDPKSGKILRHQHLDGVSGSLSGDIIRSIFVDSKGTVWVGTLGAGLNKYQPESNNFKVYHANYDDETALSSNSIFSINELETGQLMIGTDGNGIDFYDFSTKVFNNYNRNHQNSENFSYVVYSISKTRDGNYWIATDGGVKFYNPKKDFIRSFYHDNCNLNSPVSNNCRSALVDNNGIIWIGTEAGVSKVVETENFLVFRNDPNNENSIEATTVRTMFEDANGSVWIGYSSGGFDIYNFDTKEWKKIRHNPEDPNSFPNNGIADFTEDSFGNLWIGLGYGGILKYDPYSDTFEQYLSSENPNSLHDNRVQIIKEGKKGILWIGTENGLSRYDISNNKWDRIVPDPNNPNSLSGGSIQPNALAYDYDENALWVGTWADGLNQIDLSKGFENYEITHYKNDPNNPESISNNNIISLYYDGKGNIWAGTFGGGLGKFDTKTKTFKTYTDEDGLSNNIVFGIHGDNKGNIWASTDNGISMLNPETEVFLTYSMEDGLQDNKFFWGSSHKGQSGKIYFGSISGLAVFNPDSLKTNNHIPHVYINDIKRNNESVKLEQSISFADNLKLSYKENSFILEVSSLDYTAPRKNQYKYMLEGIDKDWIENGNRNVISYNNLAPGRYTLKIMGSNDDLVWSEESTNLNIRITPPWWKTLFFKIFFVLLVAAAIWFLIKERIKKNKHDKAILQSKIEEGEKLIQSKVAEVEKQEEEIRLRDKQEHEIRYTNQGISKFSEVLSRQEDSIEHLSKELISELVSYTDSIMGALYIVNDSDEDNLFLELTGWFAIDNNKIENKQVQIGESYVGTCFKQAETLTIKDVPSEYMKFSSGLGETSPAYLCLVPIKLKNNIQGVIELASFKAFEDYVIKFVERIAENTTAVITIIKSSERTNNLLENSQQQTEELKAQEEEMRQNIEELMATQEEMKRQEEEWSAEKQELNDKIKELKKTIKEISTEEE